MSENKVNRDNFILLQGWMLTELGLKGNELIIYACIYGFSQAENQVFSGTLQYLADWTNSTKRSVINCLQSLVEKGYIVKTDKAINGVKFCEYHAAQISSVVKKVHWGGEKSSPGGGEKSSPNNIDIDNIEDNLDNNKPRVSVSKSSFSKPTLDEVRAYCLERRNGIDPQSFLDHYDSNGWMVGRTPMKDWKASVRTWERRRNTPGMTTNQPSPRFEPQPNFVDE